MAITLTEIFLLGVLPIVIIVLLVRWLRLRKRRITESVILSLIRSKNGVTIDDVIIGAHVSADEAGALLRKLLARGILRVEEKNGKTIYKIT
jgi:predicted transcriptional regulator